MSTYTSPSTSALDLYCQELDSLESIRHLVQQRQWAAALKVTEQMADRFADDADFRTLQATVYLNWAKILIADAKDDNNDDDEKKEYSEARSYLLRGIQANPTESHWKQLDRCYRQMERQLGLDMYDIVCRLNPIDDERCTPI